MSDDSYIITLAKGITESKNHHKLLSCFSAINLSIKQSSNFQTFHGHFKVTEFFTLQHKLISPRNHLRYHSHISISSSSAYISTN